MDTMSFYGLSSEIKQIEEIMLDSEYEIDEKAILKKQEELLPLIKTKTDSVVGYHNYCEDVLIAIKKRINELQIAYSTIESRLERFEGRIRDGMDLMGVSKIEGNIASISISKATKKVNILNEEIVKGNIEFIKVKQVIDIDITKIKDALKAGVKVDGAILVDGKRAIKFKAGK